ncbi:MAG: hypothetical protein HY059_09075 [Proteobacteria bacterium]|nr:hypothetical protein [Pseudomonadota bacterium]
MKRHAVAIALIAGLFGPGAVHADPLAAVQEQAGELHLTQFTPSGPLSAPARLPDLSAVTTVSSPHPIVGVLKTMAEQHIGEPQANGKGAWRFKDPIGQSISARYNDLVSELPALGPRGGVKKESNGSLTCVKGDYYATAFDIGYSVANTNKLMECGGFSIRLAPPSGPDPVSAGATIIIEEDWVSKGETVYLPIRGASKPAAYLKGVSFFKTSNPYPVAAVRTKTAKGTNNTVYFTPYDGKFPTGTATAVYDKAKALSREKQAAALDYDGVVVPKAEYSHVDETLLVDGSVIATHPARRDKTYDMAQFKFEQKIKIHQDGVSLKAAAVGQAVGRSLPREPNTSRAFKIDDTYLFWVEVNGMIPFAGLITPSHMKEPAR